MIAEALRTHEVPARSLVVEITESSLIVDTDNAGRILNTLRDIGVGVAIDDFGNGYSSLSYLQRFPVDYLKVDRSFISGIGSNPGSGTLAHAIVRLAGTLGVVAIAEGIELDRQAASLRRWGCQLGQGFLFARPTPPDGLNDMLLQPERVSMDMRAALPQG
jgi:EAL domain-containing protein (putative c-di-GMP-specific phosphodiesterase class I)